MGRLSKGIIYGAARLSVGIEENDQLLLDTSLQRWHRTGILLILIKEAQA
jgi:hypothetical protein